MKVQCDVCRNAQATVMCCADEAALCGACDSRVHAANKLASKHQRVPLLQPAALDGSPQCDICKEQTGFFFCVEDRALLCRNCDVSIHSSNALLSKHRRLLITGIQVGLQPLSSDDEINKTSSSPSTPNVYLQSLPSPKKQAFSKPLATPPCHSPASPAKSNEIQVNAQLPIPKKMKSKESSVIALSGIGLLQQSAAKNVSLGKLVENQSQLSLDAALSQMSSFQAQSGILTPFSSINPVTIQQASFQSERSPLELGPFPSASCPQLQPMSISGVNSIANGGGGSSLRKNSISEYLNETIPGWRVDELLNINDTSMSFNFSDAGPSKTDQNSGDEWIDGSVLDVLNVVGETAAEVPSLPSPPTSSGILRIGKPWGYFKSSKKYFDPSFLLDWDDSLLVVPDVGGVSTPSHSPPPQKRSRIDYL